MPSVKDIERKEFLLPVIASAVTAGGTFAAHKLLNGNGSGLTDKLGGLVGDQADSIKESLEDSGGAVGLATKAADKLGSKSSGGGSRGQGWGRGRRLPIQHSIEVPVPIAFAYDEWTNFEKLGDFLHRVESVEPKGENKVVWHENIWGRRREWRAEITEKRRNQLIAWKDEHGTGVLSFHSLAPRLTRIELNYDWVPHGMLEKLASGLRFHKRAARTDLQRFKAHAVTKYAKHRNGNGTATPGRRKQTERA
jgi:uncharacterized membrane protein